MRALFATLAIAALMCSCPGVAAEPQVIPLWNGAAPGSEDWTWSEESTVSPVDHTGSIRNVVRPTITVHLPPHEAANGTGMLVIPGGGFQSLAWGKEGDRIAEWLNSIGIAAFVLKYRIAHTGDEAAKDQATINARANAAALLAFEDARQAMRLVRRGAASWGVRPDRIGVIGFSAGGYLAVRLGASDDAAMRPDFVAAIYPGSPPGLTVAADAPPLFLAVAADDPHVPRDSFGAFDAWRKAGRSAELHVYAKGGHGFALRKQGLPVNTWNDRLVDWMRWQGWLGEAASASPAH